jgi:hypothetical protein
MDAAAYHDGKHLRRAAQSGKGAMRGQVTGRLAMTSATSRAK